MKPHHSEQLLLSEIQVLLAEKRTYFAILRTGLGIITVPFTTIIFLAATAQYHGIFNHSWLAAVVIGSLFLVSASGIRITYQSKRKIRQLDELIAKIERENRRIAEIIV